MKRYLLVFLALMLLMSCKQNTPPGKEPAFKGKGQLAFTANGEDFVRQGLTSKDGWKIVFDVVWVNLSGLTAYQLPKSVEELEHNIPANAPKAEIPGDHSIDLAAGDENAPPIVVGAVENAPAGFYNGLAFSLRKAASGECAGYSVVLKGRAQREGREIVFSLKFDEEIKFTGGAYVGKEIKGVLEENKRSEIEMTFHFDHIFGDGSLEANHELNQRALGFEPFAAFAVNGKVYLTQTELRTGLTPGDCEKLTESLRTLGHVGEGHCKSE